MTVVQHSLMLPAPPADVWSALIDHRAFGKWFKVDLEGAFVEGAVCIGRTTDDAFKGHEWRVVVDQIDPERAFVFRWRPEDQPGFDIELGDVMTVAFTLAPHDGGTRLTITESGFENLPDTHRAEFVKMSREGWAIQAERLKAFLAQRETRL